MAMIAKIAKWSQSTAGVTVRLQLQEDGYDLPSRDALAQILTNYPHSKREQQRPAERLQANKLKRDHTYHVHHPHKRPPLHDYQDVAYMAEITDHQTKEVENYRSAMSKMADDIIALRTQVLNLEAENSQLHADLSLHRDLGRDLLDDTDIDVMTKAEIADRIASLKFKLASETSKGASQRDRIQQLQNDLIKKNDSEKMLLRLQRDHQQQQEDLQRRQSRLEKMATSEATVKHQEKIIEKIEKALDSKLREKNKQTGDQRLVLKKQRDETGHRKEARESALAAENTRLREELERIQQPDLIITQQTKDTLPLKERLSLLNKLEAAETRVQTLEAQLEENSKLWGRQKQEMLTKLSEHRHGFVRTSTTILHNVPSVS
ncbi:coiled-coil domain-containing protein 33 [Chelmon rostratus]|uniref:coiled-coil domain-containing protein 33 n=1 Tax=Chelmon rostratus TaxID=109905 RepID=UPI001BED12BE|nr:coiled-coil domain-containing protein 33 [Chelmon rostratus]